MLNLNRNLFEFLFGWSGKSAVIDVLIVFVAKFLPYLVALGLLAWVFSRAEWKLRWFLFAEGAMGVILARGIVTEAVRFFYRNPRPFEVLNLPPLISESSSSFPSAHAAFFFALATTGFYHSRRLGWWIFGLAAAIGLGRVIAGVHWPLDILSGMGIGILSAAIAHRLVKPQLERLEKKTLVAIENSGHSAQNKIESPA